MTISSKRFTRPLILAAVFAAIFTILPSRVDHGALFGVSAAMAHGTSSASHGGFGTAGGGVSVSDHDLGQGSPRNGGPNSDPTTSGASADIAHGVDTERAWDQVPCAWHDCH